MSNIEESRWGELIVYASRSFNGLKMHEFIPAKGL